MELELNIVKNRLLAPTIRKKNPKSAILPTGKASRGSTKAFFVKSLLANGPIII